MLLFPDIEVCFRLTIEFPFSEILISIPYYDKNHLTIGKKISIAHVHLKFAGAYKKHVDFLK